jgi:hypothetical protein
VSLIVKKPIRFDGSNLEINFATSAAGDLRVEIQDADGKPVPGFGLSDCDVQFGDQPNRIVSWKSKSDVNQLAGKIVQLRFELKDADLYAFRFSGKK